MKSLTRRFSDRYFFSPGAASREPKIAISKAVISTRAPEDNSEYVRLEIRADTLQAMIKNKPLFVEDIRGLDRQAKSWVKRILLENLAERRPWPGKITL